ncbi:MAG: hypothetical protein H0U82_09075 [Actinobacteria bacterium]|nr:hypothetical protein [Actinomycetota bacterium]
MSTPEEHTSSNAEAGYGGAATSVTEDTPPQVQPQRPEHETRETGGASTDEREEQEAAEQESGRGAV